ncbi:histidine--tRNA ligase [Candidatus Saccharibacteria bacterium]|nr:histidine--tRNA ligase [Candidatus Saccharibacteria bacterium]
MSLNTSSYKGARDLYPEDMRLRRYIFDTWTKISERFGYEKYDAPILEPLELYAAKSGEEIVNEQTYTFFDRGDRRVTIRPEMTPSVARMVAARRQEIPLPARLYSIANFMRYERPQKGREREFWQLNVDIFGVPSVEADVEVIQIADAILREFGANENMFTIRINDRRLTDYLMRTYLDLDEKDATAMIKLLDRRAKISTEIFDETAREIFADAADEKMPKLNQLLQGRSLQDLPNEIRGSGLIADLEQLLGQIEIRGITSVKFDVTLMRGFDYYTGIVFEVFDQNPDNKRAMFGGGRYDGLVGLFGVEDMPVVGFAPGETTTMEFLRTWNLLPELKPATDVILVPLGDVNIQSIVDQLRAASVNVAVDFTDRKIDKKIRAAVKIGAPYLLFVGEEEIKTGQYTLKNVMTEREEKLTLNNIIDVMAK